jgi:alanyl-tRNA synthetase
MGREEFLNLPFFKERGFVLKKCKVCGKEFWTLDPEREVCGDQPCVDYEFIGRRGAVGFERPADVREAFLSFFERKGHARVRRYPVVARWREDVYLVGASIYDFQPWVTEGIVEPPANPLVISQPSIRLTDVDNVGRSGRHLTGFEMMAHHAFNIRGKEVYWANETVEYAFEVLTDVFKIPPEEITFKFDWWSGGGNAGEDYEVLARGLELATLVFMHYKVADDGRLIEMPNRIVDTGYGLERLLWFLKGTPTVYDAVFGSLVEELRARAGLAPLEPRILEALARKSGKLDFKEPERAFAAFREIARSMGMKPEELWELVSPYHSLYALLDHARSIMWMLGDGVVPSNVGAGYLARLLIRRALRHLWRLGLGIPLAEVVAMQIRAWASDFPEYEELEDEILDMVHYEESRYKETLDHGRKVVERVARELKAKGVGAVPVDTLLTLYESHGLPPEFVAEEASKFHLTVEVPPNFYSMLASRHEASPRKPAQLDEALLKLAEGLPPTRKLYYEDPRALEFEAKVLRVLGSAVILDQTAFYPEGGGQPHDEGTLEWGGGSCRVVRVFKVGDVVVHECEGELPPEGSRVRGRVNSERRLALMRNHTATHILLGAARRVLGKHVWQAGAQKGVEQSRLDITHHRKITVEELRAIEELANRVVMENRPVNVFFADRTAAEMKYGFVLYQGGVVPEPKLRIVEIEGWDVEACGGIHCSRTGEVGLIKIVKVERIQDGVSRIVFKVGDAALKHVWQMEDALNEIAQELGVDVGEAAASVKELAQERDRLAKELSKARETLLEIAASELASKAEEVAGVKLVAGVVELEDVRELALRVARRLQRAVVGLVNGRGEYAVKVDASLVREGLDARRLSGEISKRAGGRGGGAPDLVSGRVENPGKFPEALRDALLEALAAKA